MEPTDPKLTAPQNALQRDIRHIKKNLEDIGKHQRYAENKNVLPKGSLSQIFRWLFHKNFSIRKNNFIYEILIKIKRPYTEFSVLSALASV